MAFPIHPSRGDYDLMYSVLYDDFTAEAAIAAIAALDAEEPFPDPPVQNIKVRITFVADTGGHLQGQTVQLVQKGSVPVEVPTVVTNSGYEFVTWTLNGEPVDPATYVITGDTEFVATFVEVVPEVYLITIYDVAPRTTQTGSDGIAVHTFNVKEGDSVYPEMFGVTNGPVFNSAGEYMDTFDEKPTHDTWY